MKKNKLGLFTLLIIVLAMIGSIYYTTTVKTKSLPKDILSEVNFNKVKVKFVYDTQTDKRIEFDKSE